MARRLTSSERALRAITEREWQRMIIERARALGWAHAHVHPAMVNGKWITPTSTGFPDLWLVRDGRLVVFECKRETGELRDGQQEWIDALNAVPGVDAMVARPSDWQAVMSLLG